MKIEKVLEYQNLDREMFNIEKQLKDNENKKKANKLYEDMKNAQARSYKLEEKAEQILTELDKVKKQYQIQEDKMKEFMSKKPENLSKEDVAKLSQLKDRLNQNIQILEKNLASLAESMNAVLSEFNKAIKTINSSKEEYAQHKNAYDEDVKEIDKEKAKIAEKLKALSVDIDAKIMEAYTKRRRENVFPVVVPLKGNSCGGCHVELPFANITKLNEEGILSCEHCRRIIYKAQN